MIKILIKKRSEDYKEFAKKLNATIKKNRICIARNCYEKKDIRKILLHFQKSFLYSKDIRHSGEIKKSSKDFQRLDLGNNYKNTRFMRVMYASEFNKKNNELYKILKKIITIRNLICGIKKINKSYPLVTGVKKKIDKKKFFFSDFSRLIQYPVGGGFLECHNDYDEYYAKGVIQIIIPLTQKTVLSKKNYINGSYDKGGFYFKINSKKINIEKYIKLGDVLFFNPKISHGIDSIDSNEKLCLNKLNGRITLAISVSHIKNI